jgi:SH3-like domain-containing protein
MSNQRYLRPVIATAVTCAMLLACGLLTGPPPTATSPAMPPTSTSATPPTVTSSVMNTATAAPTDTPAATDTPADTPTAEATSTPSGPLRGTVSQRSNCRYGPGASYLYKLGYKAGTPIVIIGRTADGGWAQTQDDCWINRALLEIDGDIMAVPDTYRDSSSLPYGATKYGAASVTSVSGGGGAVTVDWTAVDLPDYAMVSDIETEYVVEVWTCRNGIPAFYSVGTNETTATFDVHSSCGETSRADLVVQNKAGVSGVSQIPLP